MGIKFYCDYCGCEIVKPANRGGESRIELNYGTKRVMFHRHCFNVCFSTDIEKIKSITNKGNQ